MQNGSLRREGGGEHGVKREGLGGGGKHNMTPKAWSEGPNLIQMFKEM